MKRKNLEKAIIMSLLAASISVPVWAVDQTSGPLWNEGWNGEKIVDNGDNLIVNAGSSVGIGPQGTVNVINGDLTVNTTYNGIEAGYSEGATVDIWANNVSIDAGENGLYVGAEGGYGIVNIGSDKRKVDGLTIIAKGQGIDNKLGSVTIYGSENSVINISTDSSQGIKPYQDGIINENGQVIIEGGNITVSAANGNGINNESEQVDIDAVGLVTITANDKEKTDVNYAGIHNTSGITEITAGQGIVVTGSRDGVVAESGIIQLTGGALNKVNADDDGVKAVGSDSNVILNAKENIISVNDANNRDSVNGIYADNNGQVDITSTEGNLKVTVETEGTHAHGVYVGATTGGDASLTTLKGDIVIDVITGAPNATGGNVYGVRVQHGGTATLDSGNNVIITTQSQVVNTTTNNVVGVDAQYAASRVDIDADGYVYIDSQDANSANFGIRANEGASVIDITSTGKNVDGYGVIIKSSGAQSHAAYAQNASFSIDATNAGNGGGIYISADGKKATDALYVNASNQNSSGRLAADGDIVLSAYNDAAQYASTDYVSGIYTNASGAAATTEVTGKNIIVSAVSENNVAYGLYAFNGGGGNTVDVSGNDISVVSNGYKGYSYGVLSTNSDVDITATGNTSISSTGYGIYAWNNTGSDSNNSNVTISSAGNNTIYGYSTAVMSSGVNTLSDIDSTNGTNLIVSEGTAVRAAGGAVNSDAAVNNLIIANTGLWSEANGTIKLNADLNHIAADAYGIFANSGNVGLDGTVNFLNVAVDDQGYGSGHAIQASSKAQVNLNATAGDNVLAGVIYAKDEDTNVTLSHKNSTDTGSGSNYIYSSAHGSEDDLGDRSHVVAALYAQRKGKINVTAGEGGVNYIASDYAFEHEEDSEHTVWAQRGGIIEIKGSTIIKSSNAEDYYAEGGYNTNSRGIAITAGSDEIITDVETNNMVTVADEDRSRVNLEYGAGSAIYGDIVSGYGGWVNVKAENGGSLDMQGNALAGNGGILNLEIADGSTWYGRADDYGDAGYGEDAQNKQEFYNPAFSNAIIEGGQVNVTMGEGSTWYLTGQSWVSSLDVSNGNGNVTIDMQEFNEGTHGLTIAEMTGKNDGTIDATFVMSLNHDDHGTSDMLYIKNGTGEYDVVLKEAIDGMENINEDNVLRFATVQGGAQFNSVTMDNVGLYNLGFEIDHSEYDTAETTENQGYNGVSVDENKPGNENVEGFFDLDETAADEGPSNIMLLADQNQRADDSVQNWFITRVSGQEISDAGKTVVAMSKVNYSNAVYMDRLNKRLGEARYINNEEDQGMWVRLRHDRIGKSDEFRSMNTMYELGYDEKQECDNGERRVGAAIDYMDGSSEYSNVAGTGDISRKGIWLYDTWMGDKGHYADYVAKWGHLSNDFKLYRDGKEITGDYSNNVYSISAEYGRKKDIGNDWYFEPQVQLQYARVTDANYTTSQGTEVSLDAINSLIARAGFRLGKDLGERSTVYFKADLLHEFLGDQDIYAHDATGEMDVTYGNEGTWCDVGFGFAAAMSKNSYAYLDFEKSFGNDFDDTYQINAGLQWSF